MMYQVPPSFAFSFPSSSLSNTITTIDAIVTAATSSTTISITTAIVHHYHRRHRRRHRRRRHRRRRHHHHPAFPIPLFSLLRFLFEKKSRAANHAKHAQ